MPRFPEVCRHCVKGYHWTNECRSKRDIQGNILPPGNEIRAWQLEALQEKKKSPFPLVSQEITSRQENHN